MAEVISLINEKGGVGKSTSAITIAQILAISEYKILLIDLDPQMNTTKMYGQAEANPDIDYERLFCTKLNNKSEVIDFITETDYNNISILTASRELNSLIYKIYDKMKEMNVELYLRNNLGLIDVYKRQIMELSLYLCVMLSAKSIKPIQTNSIFLAFIYIIAYYLCQSTDFLLNFEKKQYFLSNFCQFL